mmetsp:Transcript_36232/g.102030  ORF Transcript_36232/g.102030 Transcript_36232/m.102030 type:complete len:117 (-) Transcript_36232:1366-1716(-)
MPCPTSAPAAACLSSEVSGADCGRAGAGIRGNKARWVRGRPLLGRDEGGRGGQPAQALLGRDRWLGPALFGRELRGVGARSCRVVMLAGSITTRLALPCEKGRMTFQGSFRAVASA